MRAWFLANDLRAFDYSEVAGSCSHTRRLPDAIFVPPSGLSPSFTIASILPVMDLTFGNGDFLRTSR